MVRFGTPVTVRSDRTTTGIDAVTRAGHTLSGHVVTTAGKPVPFVCVEAFDLAARTEQVREANQAGHYKLTGLSTGTYAVSFIPCTGRSNPLGEVTARTVHIRAGHPVVTLNAALPVAGAISGTVTSSGQPHLGSVCVAAVSGNLRGNLGAALVSVRIASVGANGQYTISHLSPGVYKVYFDDAFCRFALGSGDQVAPQWFAGKLTESTATKVTVVTAKTTNGVDASLQPFGGITGTVVTTANAPVAGACVVAVPQNTDPDPIGGVPEQTETAISGSTGRYSLIDVPPGQYKVEFTSGCGATGLATQWWDGVTSASQATVVTVQPATTRTGIDATVHH